MSNTGPPRDLRPGSAAVASEAAKPDAPAAAVPTPTAARLLRFRVDHPTIGVGPPFHSMGLVNLEQPPPHIIGWAIAFRGPIVFFISPRGWIPGTTEHQLSQLNGKGKVQIIDVPREHVTCVLEADGPEAIDRIQRFDVPPIERPKPRSEEPVVDPKEMGDP